MSLTTLRLNHHIRRDLPARRARVVAIPLDRIVELLGTSARLQLPPDAMLAGEPQVIRGNLCLRIHSASFPAVPIGEPLPAPTPIIERDASQD
ncbi:MAG: hypothetical protein QJR02_07300 [Sinobacteraceae bacterium]|nr:hypothetical protein [Nevskiaceae bacterium]